MFMNQLIIFFFQCPLAVFLWSFLRDCLGWPRSPTSCLSLFLEILEHCQGKKQMVTLFICAGALWSIWKSGNEMVFNKKVLSSPVVLVYKTLMLTKTWQPILKPKLKPMAEDMISLISAQAIRRRRRQHLQMLLEVFRCQEYVFCRCDIVFLSFCEFFWVADPELNSFRFRASGFQCKRLAPFDGLKLG